MPCSGSSLSEVPGRFRNHRFDTGMCSQPRSKGSFAALLSRFAITYSNIYSAHRAQIWALLREKRYLVFYGWLNDQLYVNRIEKENIRTAPLGT